MRVLEWLKRPEAGVEELARRDGRLRRLPPDLRRTLEIEIKYAGYVERQVREIEGRKKLEGKLIPKGMEFKDLEALSIEAREWLARVTPTTLGQAARIPGMRPSDIAVLAVYVEQRARVGREGTAGGRAGRR